MKVGSRDLIVVSLIIVFSGVALSLLYNSLFLFLVIPIGFGWGFKSSSNANHEDSKQDELG